MSVVYSLYDALVSINVPDEKAKAVIDAMEREMMDKLATKVDIENLRIATRTDIGNLRIDFENLRHSTKADIDNLRLASQADLAHAREIISRDIKDVALGLAHVRESLGKDIQSCATKVELADLGRSLITRLYVTTASAVALNCTIVFGILRFLR